MPETAQLSFKPGLDLRIQTERYRLRPLTISDVSARYLGWLQDPTISRYLEVRFQDCSPPAVTAWVAAHDLQHRFLLGIFDRMENEHVGNYRLVCHPHHSHAHLGVLVGQRTHWGVGLVKEVMPVLVDFAFDQLGMHKVCGRVYSTNAPALFNYKAQGFSVEGVLEQHVLDGNGRRADLILFAMKRATWQQMKP